ncbi:hypothetical protein HMPREF3198_00003 [Winkia neuii]|nr:hypothetical protein HMPREF3198_00003 [Winkia neuii]
MNKQLLAPTPALKCTPRRAVADESAQNALTCTFEANFFTFERHNHLGHTPEN